MKKTTFACITIFWSLILLVTCGISAGDSGTINKKTELERQLDKINALKQNYQQIAKQQQDAFTDQKKNIEKTFYIKLNKVKKDYIPKPLEPRGMFETTNQYHTRVAAYEVQVKQQKKELRKNLDALKKNFDLRFEIARAETDYLKELIRQTTPIINTLKEYQNNYYAKPDAPTCEITWFPPEPDLHRFPVHIIDTGKTTEDYIYYKTQEQAKQIWQYRYSFKADKLFQYSDNQAGETSLELTAFRILSPRIPDKFYIKLSEPEPFKEVLAYKEITENALPSAKLMVALKNEQSGPVTGMKFVYISPRKFTMGSPRTEEGRWADETQHDVILTKGFYLQTTEVTQGQWRAIMGNNPSLYQKCGSECPVENVYWGDVQEYIDRLNKLDKSATYRLPTEAEWEYACRAGSDEMGAYGNNPNLLEYYGWYRKNANGGPHLVAQKRPNHWNLYDMHGNVSEWCSDWYGKYPVNTVKDPQGPFRGKFRVARGGSWFHSARRLRSADRNADMPGDRSGYLGFRLVMEKMNNAIKFLDE